MRRTPVGACHPAKLEETAEQPRAHDAYRRLAHRARRERGPERAKALPRAPTRIQLPSTPRTEPTALRRVLTPKLRVHHCQALDAHTFAPSFAHTRILRVSRKLALRALPPNPTTVPFDKQTAHGTIKTYSFSTQRMGCYLSAVLPSRRNRPVRASVAVGSPPQFPF